MSKTNILAVTVLALSIAAPTAALAWDGKRPPRRGEHHPAGIWDAQALPPGLDLPAERQADFKQALSEHFKAMLPLKRSIADKYEEIEYLSRLQSTQPKDLTKLLAEARALQDQAWELSEATAKKFKADFNLDPEQVFYVLRGAGRFCDGFAHGFHGPARHGRGWGHGFGPDPDHRPWHGGRRGLPPGPEFERDRGPAVGPDDRGPGPRYDDPDGRGRWQDRRDYRHDRGYGRHYRD